MGSRISRSPKDRVPAVRVLLGKGDGTFEAPIVYTISGAGPTALLTAADLNGDGATDLIAVTR